MRTENYAHRPVGLLKTKMDLRNKMGGGATPVAFAEATLVELGLAGQSRSYPCQPKQKLGASLG
jgi:hypothetical protein